MFIFLIIVSIVVVIANLWYDYVGWFYLLIVNAILFATLLSLKSENKNFTIAESETLSLGAQALLKKYRHFYLMPFAATQYGSIAALHQFLGIVVVGLNIYQGIYWTIALAIVSWYSLAYASYFFNPLQWIARSGQTYAHEEVVEFVNRMRK